MHEVLRVLFCKTNHNEDICGTVLKIIVWHETQPALQLFAAIPQQSILTHHKSFYLRYFSGKRLV